MVYPCDGILLNTENGMNHYTCSNTKLQKHYTKWKKLHTEDYVLYDYIYVEFLETAKL